MTNESVPDENTRSEIFQKLCNPLSCLLYNMSSLDRDLPPLLAAMKRCRNLIVDNFGLEKALEVFGEACDPVFLDDVAACVDESSSGVKGIIGATQELKEYWGFDSSDGVKNTPH